MCVKIWDRWSSTATHADSHTHNAAQFVSCPLRDEEQEKKNLITGYQTLNCLWDMKLHYLEHLSHAFILMRLNMKSINPDNRKFNVSKNTLSTVNIFVNAVVLLSPFVFLWVKTNSPRGSGRGSWEHFGPDKRQSCVCVEVDLRPDKHRPLPTWSSSGLSDKLQRADSEQGYGFARLTMRALF